MGSATLTSGVFPIYGVTMPLTDELLAEIRTFLAAHDMSPTAFGLQAVNDGHFVHDLEGGAGITARRIDRVRRFMREYRPTGSKRRSACQPVA